MNNTDEYIEEYMKNSFEEIQVFFRRKKVLEQLNRYSHKNLLEIGCGFEPVFKYFDDFDTMTVVEPRFEFIEHAKQLAQNNPKINCIQGFFEDQTNELALQNYDFILAAGLLHELANEQSPEYERPAIFLEALKSVCSPNTVIHINVPNMYSLHRIVAKEMGLIDDVGQQSDMQIKLHQYSIFSMDSLVQLIECHHFKIIDSGSYFVKPFTHDQMYRMLAAHIIDKNVLNGLYQLAKYLPEYGSEIFVDCRVSY